MMYYNGGRRYLEAKMKVRKGLGITIVLEAATKPMTSNYLFVIMSAIALQTNEAPKAER